MISKSLFFAAKAFLCWDVFSDVSIQLIPVEKAIGFYFSPENAVHSILLFYNPGQRDFAEPLFLLFHEAGHKKQYEKNSRTFHISMAEPNGMKRQIFETEAWQLARMLLDDFIKKQNLENELLQKFDTFARLAIQTYADGSLQG
ncbi:hypothetical protein EH223_15060 [candidate division KSB1 bacterium]|nr:hypothetical protein [candidate division KSB1 bacterium]RQW01481.1 MAG: hypothetical protein EH223_15060 [candidate division KSB1 bacterium]